MGSGDTSRNQGAAAVARDKPSSSWRATVLTVIAKRGTAKTKAARGARTNTKTRVSITALARIKISTAPTAKAGSPATLTGTSSAERLTRTITANTLAGGQMTQTKSTHLGRPSIWKSRQGKLSWGSRGPAKGRIRIPTKTATKNIGWAAWTRTNSRRSSSRPKPSSKPNKI